MGEDPWPASLEKRARFMPHRNAMPTDPPMKAPPASAGLNALLKINPITSGSTPRFIASTARAIST